MLAAPGKGYRKARQRWLAYQGKGGGGSDSGRSVPEDHSG